MQAVLSGIFVVVIALCHLSSGVPVADTDDGSVVKFIQDDAAANTTVAPVTHHTIRVNTTVGNVTHHTIRVNTTVAPVTHHTIRVNTTAGNVTHHTIRPQTTSGNVTHHTIRPQTTSGNVTHHTIRPQTTSGNVTHHTIRPPTTPASSGSGRKFDGLSFFGGMLLVAGICAIAFVAWKCYAKRQSEGYKAM